MSTFFKSDSNGEMRDPVVPKRRRTKAKERFSKTASEPKPYRVSKTTPKPSVVFFPTNEDKGCGEASAIGLLHKYSYLP